jgi:WhiB family redox-sensing transcriptional regulator
MSWAARAACLGQDPDLFIPKRDERKSDLVVRHRDALEFCARCQVTKECLAYALEMNEVGIWGNTTGRQRRGMHS